MIEKACNLWLEPADWRCIPTTGATTDDGAAVMDAGVALEATQKFQAVEYDLGRLLNARGNHVHEIRPGLVSFPIKQYAWAGISVETITRSAQELSDLVGQAKTLLPRPTLSESDPSWEEIAQAISFLPDNIIVIDHH